MKTPLVAARPARRAWARPFALPLRAAGLALAVLASGCGNKPVAPDWQVEAHGSLERFTQAYLRGGARVPEAEFERARAEVARTGQVGLVARAELTRCALQLASLVVESCAGFEALRRDAPAAERAYADYLAGRLSPADIPLLPPAHRAVAGGTQDGGAVQAIADPVARLVAAGTLFRTGRAGPEVITAAVETASAQGWRRPLLAWLGVQALRADRAGAREEAERIRRRMGLVAGERAGG